MIVIDANELRRIPRAGHRLWRLLCELARDSGHSIATADITFEEFKAGYGELAREAWVKYRDAKAAFREFKDGEASRLGYGRDIEVERVIATGLAAFQENLTILPTTSDSHMEALRREVWRKRPASTSWTKPGSGARDVVLWLAALQACQELNERVYFVSNDVAAFGKTALYVELRDELKESLGDRADEFIYCRNIADLLPLLADQDDDEDDALLFDMIADDEGFRVAVDAVCSPYVGGMSRRIADAFLEGKRSPVRMQTTQTLGPVSLFGKSTYRLGDRVWLVATMRWCVTVKIEELGIVRSRQDFDSDYSGSLIEEVASDVDIPAESQEFDISFIGGMGRSLESGPTLTSIDILSARLVEGRRM
ncbi:PIN domain-containing protein [Lentzea californiensis]|uniref:PIN domain-containing protein n=1 Tax=Lentzea californiensis TaxID=438851 RepID=UPI0021663FB1|nr:PIN domain-containing protein [Lentzea californiensis]MCR3753725.1 hypothetical protein [Lentzea californiensis]